MKHKKLLLTIFTLAFLASVFLCGNAQAQGEEPWNVEAEVVYKNVVYHYSLRKEMRDSLQEASKRGFYSGAEGKKNLSQQLLQMQLPQRAVFNYVLPHFDKILNFFRFVQTEKRDATVSFDKQGFRFCDGKNGVFIDEKRLFFLLLQSKGKKITVTLPVVVDKAVSVESLQKNTVKKASFTTYYPSSGANRCFNVELATKTLNGVTVGVGETFSFNSVVGPRTQQRGYKVSKVILDGKYAEGIGGGVCQVSTTLYNALLLAEIIPKASPHSLVSSYVAAGFDAMVSFGGADLTFTNDTGSPLYIEGKTNAKNKSVTFTVYGKPNAYKVVRESVAERTKFDTVEIVDKQKYPELVYTDQIKVLVGGSDGVKSQSFLNYYDGDKLVARLRIRQNTYKKVDRLIARGDEIRQKEPF